MTTHVKLSKTAYTLHEVGQILACYIGKTPGRQRLHNWFHEARESGNFANARKERANVPNSAWVIPAEDVLDWLAVSYPGGVLPHYAEQGASY